MTSRPSPAYVAPVAAGCGIVSGGALYAFVGPEAADLAWLARSPKRPGDVEARDDAGRLSVLGRDDDDVDDVVV
jgi:hypothetical protein